MNPTACLPPLAVLLLSTAALAAPVKELKPTEVAAFIARNPDAIVQITSPDPKCGYCIGADKRFDAAAAAPGNRKLAFARVQHSPWAAIPDFGDLIKLYGVPTQVIFRSGKQVGDASIYRTDVATFYRKVDAVLAAPPKPAAPPAPAPAPTSAPAPKPLAADDSAALHTMVRRDLLRGVMAGCASRFAAGAGRYQGAIAQWEAPRKAALDKGAMLLLTGGADMHALATEEQTALQKWQANELGIPMSKKIEAADCDRFAAALPNLQ
ncbi:hypothetical protein IP91_00866 [Pseudoduganella lurida]|uniref:Thioredoxin fold domain-containing protein n=1 Tax=Pseudoduganella lurida TaxID=1036180 RepID=A0A562RLL8_9BURK|nr:hypothetical protein [Pseudoduganella lurida]TWI69793.1 hypothetical protein IP91_00866 [Pseudoduganella lurida]